MTGFRNRLQDTLACVPTKFKSVGEGAESCLGQELLGQSTTQCSEIVLTIFYSGVEIVLAINNLLRLFWRFFIRVYCFGDFLFGCNKLSFEPEVWIRSWRTHLSHQLLHGFPFGHVQDRPSILPSTSCQSFQLINCQRPEHRYS